MDEGKYIGTVVVIFLLLFTTIITGGIYFYHAKDIDNFQVTIGDLSDEQKCSYICGFEFGGSLLDKYKFCLEKCDRISERENTNCKEQLINQRYNN